LSRNTLNSFLSKYPVNSIIKFDPLAFCAFTKDKRCYAWSYELEGSKKRRFFVVLHHGPVDSAVKAVIIQDYKTKRI
jgi:hypothetical protein